ncbi:hypothetical protein GCM10027321_00810 [Massilia terrae]|uniref:T6SS immunity protein Tli4 family protein n=1 Tax=Massilia terrae TaxID=1811224 RepID=A0ABT2CUA1_9BURK|nr:T6SS immunity protein Tli4 family protein [Massilia terrae]MCS0657555.1 T6SS immunity protein Tli4 family protein [Massilia terrae]
MKRDNNKKLVALLVLAFLMLSSVRAVEGILDWTKVAMMTRTMKTVCLGRFLIDLPGQARISMAPAFVDGFDIVSHPETDDEFNARVAAREAELRSQANGLGKPSLEKVREYRDGGKTGKVLVSGRWRDSLAENGKLVPYEGVAVDAYLRSGDMTFILTAIDYDPAKIDNALKLFAKLSARKADEIPSERGFCIGRGFIRDPLSAEQGESVALLAGLPDHPDVNISFSSVVGAAAAPGIIERSAQAMADYPLILRPAVRTLREGVRTVNGLGGEEIGVKITEPNFVTTFTYDWEMRAGVKDVLAPLLALQLQTGVPLPGGRAVQSSLAEGAVNELWENIVASIRVRPSMAAKAPADEPAAPILGTLASAGDSCPSSGWWQCNEGGDGVSVLGGKRQFLRKGQRMPQALLMPRPSLWDKMRGLQPSYESVSPTGWKLVDRRARGRGASSAPLALAGLAAGDASAASAPLGSCARTGELCPVSGWWRCEDAEALDGTRWFGQGGVLPDATFSMPPAWFAKNGGGPPVIQRRCSWKLVRRAEAPHAERVAEEDPAV